MAEKTIEQLLKEKGLQKITEIASVNLFRDLEHSHTLKGEIVAVYKGCKEQHYSMQQGGRVQQYANYDIYKGHSRYWDKERFSIFIGIPITPHLNTNNHEFKLAGVIELAEKLGKESCIVPVKEDWCKAHYSVFIL